MNTLLLRTALLIFCFLCAFGPFCSAQRSGPPQIHASFGGNWTDMTALNRAIAPSEFAAFSGTTGSIGIGLEREIRRNIIFMSDVYINIPLKYAGSTIQLVGWHTTFGYAVINNKSIRLIPFTGFSINTMSLNATKPNTVTAFNTYVNGSSDQLSLFSAGMPVHLGLQFETKKSGENVADFALKIGYGFSHPDNLYQRGSTNPLSGSPALNPCGFYARLCYFIK